MKEPPAPARGTRDPTDPAIPRGVAGSEGFGIPAGWQVDRGERKDRRSGPLERRDWPVLAWHKCPPAGAHIWRRAATSLNGRPKLLPDGRLQSGTATAMFKNLAASAGTLRHVKARAVLLCRTGFADNYFWPPPTLPLGHTDTTRPRLSAFVQNPVSLALWHPGTLSPPRAAKPQAAHPPGAPPPRRVYYP